MNKDYGNPKENIEETLKFSKEVEKVLTKYWYKLEWWNEPKENDPTYLYHWIVKINKKPIFKDNEKNKIELTDRCHIHIQSHINPNLNTWMTIPTRSYDINMYVMWYQTDFNAKLDCRKNYDIKYNKFYDYWYITKQLKYKSKEELLEKFDKYISELKKEGF